MGKGRRNIVHCPTCRKEVVWGAQSKWRPFCSERCKLIDLGEWFDERHRISDPAQVDLPSAEDYDPDTTH